MKQYYINIKNKKRGPFLLTDLLKENINSDTDVWATGMENWAKASELPELSEYLKNLPPPLKSRSKSLMESKRMLIAIAGLIFTLIFLFFCYNTFVQYQGEKIYELGLEKYKNTNIIDTLMFKESIAKNNKKAENLLGRYYHLKGDTLKAINHYKNAIGNGGEFGLWQIERSLEKRDEYFRIFLNQESSQDDEELWWFNFRSAIMYYNNENNPNNNLELALKLFERASNNGSILSSVILGQHFMNKETKNEKKALEFYKKAELGGFSGLDLANIYFKIGSLYLSSTDNSIKNYKEALRYYTKAAEIEKGLYSELGLFYYKGLGVPKDEKKAYEYFKISAENGSNIGKFNLAVCYYNGDGTEVNLKEFERIIKELVDDKYPDAIEFYKQYQKIKNSSRNNVANNNVQNSISCVDFIDNSNSYIGKSITMSVGYLSGYNKLMSLQSAEYDHYERLLSVNFGFGTDNDKYNTRKVDCGGNGTFYIRIPKNVHHSSPNMEKGYVVISGTVINKNTIVVNSIRR